MQQCDCNKNNLYGRDLFHKDENFKCSSPTVHTFLPEYGLKHVVIF
jgi:hypothetical protein